MNIFEEDDEKEDDVVEEKENEEEEGGWQNGECSRRREEFFCLWSHCECITIQLKVPFINNIENGYHAGNSFLMT